ncbi:MAG: 16S rRNA processing protein RimM [Flavobacteriales bacterium]|nr:16S rRNA processing protein RimM [Flavobacteriales bacterium]|tara:strand:+ start:63 stop:584 length:522 start_codon:yes stop_codon:yes gene_type:complete
MQKKDCFLVGTVFKLHGYKGDVNIYNDDDIFLDFNTITYFLIEQDNTLIPFFIAKARPTKRNVILVKFEDINSEKEALAILKKNVYLPTKFFLKSNKETIFEKKLLGFKVLDVKLGDLGRVTAINSQTPQQLIHVSKNEKEFCFPMHEQFIISVNDKKQIIEIKIPEDLITLN